MPTYKTTFEQYRDKLMASDAARKAKEWEYIIEQQQQVSAGTREAINWPDGSERREEIRYSVGPAVEVKQDFRPIKYRPDGSAYRA